jgi:hypothetical protein
MAVQQSRFSKDECARRGDKIDESQVRLKSKKAIMRRLWQSTTIWKFASSGGYALKFRMGSWLTDQSFLLITQPLLPHGEKGSWAKMFSKSPSPALGEGLG